MFTELGPFYPNPNGTTLFENIYSWNKLANVIFLESPRNVGFSYGKNDTYNDELTTTDTANALIEFFKRFPEYNGRDFYVSGESYAGNITIYSLNMLIYSHFIGVYVPRLVEKLVDLIIEDVKLIITRLLSNFKSFSQVKFQSILLELPLVMAF